MRPVPDFASTLGVLPEMGFRQRVYTVVAAIPFGTVLGYGQVGAILGSPRLARQVGFALAALEPGTRVPWWRVIRTDGTIALQGDPMRGPEQARLLRQEGIEVDGFAVDMRRWRWEGP